MTSTIKLYKNCKIIPERNFQVNGLATYLATFTDTNVLTISDFQYQKIFLDMSIKINKGQESLRFINANNFNYVQITQNNSNYYFFVVGKEWKSEECIQLNLKMDVLNTFPYNEAFAPSALTRVLREHKDRIGEAITFSETEQVANPSNFVSASSYSFEDSVYTITINIPLSSLRGSKVYGQTITLNDIIIDERIEGTDYTIVSSSASITNPIPRRYYLSITLVLSVDPEIESDFEQDLYNDVSMFAFDATCALSITKYPRLIDLYSEGINPVLYKKELGNLIDFDNSKWYLIYNKGASDVVECYLAPENTTNVSIKSGTTSSVADLVVGKYYIISNFYNGGKNIKIKVGSNYFTTFSGWDVTSLWYSVYVLQRNGVNIDVYSVMLYQTRITGLWEAKNKKLVASAPTISYITNEESMILGVTNTFPDRLSHNFEEIVVSFSNVSTSAVLNSIDSLDRTISTLYKIIALPYCPSFIEYGNQEDLIYVGEEWQYDNTYGFLKLKNLNTKFSNTILSNITNPIKDNLYFDVLNPSTSATRNDIYESKIFNSEFYQPKFIYDSFTFTFQLEKIDYTTYLQEGTSYFSFDFIMTSTINSKFLFKFYYPLTYSTEDYDNVAPVSRNNEVPIYNDAYLTYLRTAYRYDLKTIERQNKTSWIGTALSVGGGLATTAFGAITQNPFAVASGVTSLVTGIANNLMNTIANQNQREQNMEAKLAQLKAQTFSVSGSDDIDLLEAYSDNKAKLVEYIPSPRMKKMLLDLFYYTGYICDEMKIPNVNTRYWFNFLQCELVIKGGSTKNKYMTEEILKEIKTKYLEGVTFLHLRNLNQWDFAQTKENWELSLLED